MFLNLLYNLRAQGLKVGTGEFLVFLDGIAKGLVHRIEDLYELGRAVLCRTEADWDAYDLAFAATFKGFELESELLERLEEWLKAAIDRASDELVDPDMLDEEMLQTLLERMKEQTEQHDGGNRWIGTGGTSPFGHSGRASKGVRIGGKGGNRGAIRVAGERRWENYRTDGTYETRDLEVALRLLRKLQREGRYELDLEETIEQCGRNGGDIEIIERRERTNQVRLVLIMDAGGSMTPHAQRVEQLFTAADSMGTFRSFDAWFFHNCPYSYLYSDYQTGERAQTADVLRDLTLRHRLVFVGDASMAPYELFSATGYGLSPSDRIPGIEWLRRLRKTCPASVWLNPDPRRWWDHPTVSAIGQIFPMHELSVEGLRDAVKVLRSPI